METASGKAEQVGFWDTVLGDPMGCFSRLEALRAVTVADLARVGTGTLDRRRRTVVMVEAERTEVTP
jgi:zinc protease